MKEERRIKETEKEEVINKLKGNADLLQKQIRKANGYYHKEKDTTKIKVYFPSNVFHEKNIKINGQLVKDENGNNKKEVISNREIQQNKIRALRDIEPILIKAKIGYMPYLEYENGF